MSCRTKHTPIHGRLALNRFWQHRGVTFQFRRKQKVHSVTCSVKNWIKNHTIRLTKLTGNSRHLCLLVERWSSKVFSSLWQRALECPPSTQQASMLWEDSSHFTTPSRKQWGHSCALRASRARVYYRTETSMVRWWMVAVVTFGFGPSSKHSDKLFKREQIQMIDIAEINC